MQLSTVPVKLQARGFGVTIIGGDLLDVDRLPPGFRLRIRSNPRFADAAIHAVRAARNISYIERGILPPRLIRERDRPLDPRDRHAVHFILHRCNCLYGGLRMTYHDYSEDESFPLLCEEILHRQKERVASKSTVIEGVRKREPSADFFVEISGWFVNPDMRQERSLGIILPAAVWAFCSLSDRPFSGIASLRASNSAASVMQRIGGKMIDGCCFEDDFYHGGVSLMTLHSHEFSPMVAPIVEWLREQFGIPCVQGHSHPAASASGG